MIDVTQLIMVEPDAGRLGWGVVRFSGYLQVILSLLSICYKYIKCNHLLRAAITRLRMTFIGYTS